MCSKLWLWACQSRKSAGDTAPSLRLMRGRRSQTITSRSGSANGSGRSSTALTTEKIAELAPMPKASATTATSVKPGFFKSIRTPYLMSCQSVSITSSFGGSKQ
jgi:hypothetical protein